MFSKKLRELRKQSKLTMKEFGEKFSLAESTISGYELGNRMPDYPTIEKIADFFGVSVDFLLGRNDDDYPLRVENAKKAFEGSISTSAKVDSLVNEIFETILEDISVGKIIHEPFRESVIYVANLFNEDIYEDFFKYKDELRVIFYLSPFKYDLLKTFSIFNNRFANSNQSDMDFYFSVINKSIDQRIPLEESYKENIRLVKIGEHIEIKSPLKPYFDTFTFIKSNSVTLTGRYKNDLSSTQEKLEEGTNLIEQYNRLALIAKTIRHSKPVYPDNLIFIGGKPINLSIDESNRLAEDLEMYRLLKAKREKDKYK